MSAIVITCITPDRPQQPQNVRSVNITSRNISLEWTEPHDNNAPIMGYRVMYQQPAFLGSDMQIVNSTVEMADITALHPGVTYNFTVVAFNEIGNSTPSNTASIRTLEEGMLVNNLSPFNFIIVAFHEIGDSASSSIPVATLTATEYWL